MVFIQAINCCSFCLRYTLTGVPLNDTNRSLTSSNTAPYIEILRGRDGRDGRDGAPGPQGLRGLQGTTGLQGPPGPRSAGVTYTRWGETTCPSVPGTELVYKGIAGGSFYNHTGGGANYLCMPEDPEYTLSFQNVKNQSFVYGAEYQSPVELLGRVRNHNVPCAVCYGSTRAAAMMIPAKTTCPQSWTREYYGYLMSALKGTSSNPHYRTMVDKDPDSIPGSGANTDGALFYHVEASCNGMPCPPYDPQKELNCVVCTK